MFFKTQKDWYENFKNLLPKMTTTPPKKIADKTCGFASIYDLKLLREPKTHVFHEDMITIAVVIPLTQRFHV